MTNNLTWVISTHRLLGLIAFLLYKIQNFAEETKMIKNTFSALSIAIAGIFLIAYQTHVNAELLIDQRYLDNGDGTITDIETNLTWHRCTVGQSWTGETCEGYAEDHNWSSAMKLSIGDWRLPTLDELDTLVHCTSNKRGKSGSLEGKNGRCIGDYQKPTINTLAFPETPTGNFWSSTLYTSEAPSPYNFKSSQSAYNINFNDGLVGAHLLSMYYGRVRLVRTP